MTMEGGTTKENEKTPGTMWQEFKHGLRDRKGAVVWGSLVGFIGFLISPLAWWNDLVINLPMAIAFAYVATLLLSPFIEFSVSAFVAWVIAGYWLSNIVGFYMIHHGVKSVTQVKGKLWHNIAISSAYTVLIVAMVYFGLADPLTDHINITPSWVAS